MEEWKTELYLDNLDEYAKELLKSCDSWSKSDTSLNLPAQLRVIMLKAARRAQRILRFTTANGVKRGSIMVCGNNSEILKILGELRDLRSLGFTWMPPRIDQLLIYSIMTVMLFGGRSFNKSSMKKSSNEGERPLREDFLNFYSNLFSHSDKPSDQQHLELEGRVSRHSESLRNLNPKPCFKAYEISSAIEKLKGCKTPGIDNISNEFFTFGNFRSICCFYRGSCILHLRNSYKLQYSHLDSDTQIWQSLNFYWLQAYLDFYPSSHHIAMLLLLFFCMEVWEILALPHRQTIHCNNRQQSCPDDFLQHSIKTTATNRENGSPNESIRRPIQAQTRKYKLGRLLLTPSSRKATNNGVSGWFS